jgi:hypothetical protein
MRFPTRRRHSSAGLLLLRWAPHLLGLFVNLTTGLFLFRRDRDDHERAAALEDIFGALSVVYESAALLKEPWTEQWEQRADSKLPPKYHEDLMGNSGALSAAHELRFATALLHQNRWRSKVEPLFETVDRPAWSRVERTLQQITSALGAIQDNHKSMLREDESGWIDHAIERFDEVRLNLRAAERRDVPVAERVSTATFGMVLVASQLSYNFLERIRQEAAEE